MKKLLLFAVGFTFAISTAQSQEVRIGAKAGVNFASIGGDDTGDYDMLTGFHLGAVVEIPINEKFAVQPEIMYSSQGASEDYNDIPYGGFGTKYESTLTLNYINVPIMAKYYLIDGLSIEAGPQFGVLVSAKAKGEAIELGGPGEGEAVSFENDAKEFYKTLDVGFGIGAGYRLNNGVFFSARYILGLTDISEDIEYIGSSQVDSFSQKNNVIQLSAGYSF
ncbi:porin family protein [Aequorivita marina]|uniref:porin family protein n=1 Tax=Aequorivita marina TaxID=3073654 RepID=UPI00287435A8|nr:porin family protein [Aequorivita sp. S2608]MDS1297537.1 porin family protein [Aequorivita sp. S2608]